MIDENNYASIKNGGAMLCDHDDCEKLASLSVVNGGGYCATHLPEWAITDTDCTVRWFEDVPDDGESLILQNRESEIEDREHAAKVARHQAYLERQKKETTP